jgi:hypothetical protein
VLLAAEWTGYLSTQSSETERVHFRALLKQTIDALRETGARVWIMKQVPMQEFNVPRVLGAYVEHGRDISSLGLSVATSN